MSVTYLPGSVNKEKRPDLSSLKSFGIAGYLDDLFTTTVPYVKDVIIANSAVDTTGAGTSEAIKHVESLLKSEMNLFFTPESRYNKVRSRYGDRSISTSVAPVKPAKLLSGVNIETVREAKRRMEEKKREVDVLNEHLQKHEQEEQQINLKINNSRKERDNMNNEKKKADTVLKKLEMKEKQLTQIQKEEDTEKEEENLKAKIKGVNVTRARQAGLLMKIVKQLVQSQITMDEASLTRIEAQAALHKANEEMKAIEATFSNLKRELEEVSKRFERARDLARKLKEDAEKKAPITPDLKEQIAELPNNIEELEVMIKEHTTKIEMLYATNPAVVQQYEARMREIEDITSKLQDEKTRLADLKAEISEVKDKWLPPLEALVGRINETFGRFFDEIGCVGEVGLDRNEDYDKYGIQIKVKFRNEDSLHALNSHLQSGGERSVSTMLYLISLQDITPCPFRVVDEINQGMDPYNERMIFRQVVQSAGRAGLPQYFLITPKLLPDLDYTPNMTILCVYNGPWQFTQEEWDKRIKKLFSA